MFQQPTDGSPRRYEVQNETGAEHFRNRRHIHPAIQDEPEGLNQLQAVPEPEPRFPRPGLVKHPRSTPPEVTNHSALTSLPKQYIPDEPPVDRNETLDHLQD